jgi:hypothetical protein
MSDVSCSIECQNSNVDFHHMNSKRFIPTKIWCCIPAGDSFVDISMLFCCYSLYKKKSLLRDNEHLSNR